MTIKLKNNAVGYLSTAISASDVGLVLTSGGGAAFPTLAAGEFFYATLSSTLETYEVVKITARSGDLLTIVRAQEGTSAASFASGARLELRVTAQAVSDVIDDHITTFKDATFAASVLPFLATPNSANLRSALTDDTGTGAAVFANSPTFVAPALGTPASGMLTNCTGLPADTGIAGFAILDNIAALRGVTPASTGEKVYVSGYATVGDGGDGQFYAATGAAVGTYVDDGGMIIVPTGGNGSSAWLRSGVDASTKLYKGDRINVKWFGAKGDVSTDDRLAIKAAIACAQAAGGGEIIFPYGVYVISSKEGSSYAIPIIGADYQYTTDNFDAQIYVSNLSRTRFILEGAIIKSTKTDGGYTFLFDGCNDLYFENLHMTGATVVDSTGAATTTGTNSIAFVSRSQNSTGITLHNSKFDGFFVGVAIEGNPASSYRVSNVALTGTTSIFNGRYGIALHGNGVNVTVENAYSWRHCRPFFVYDTYGVKIKMLSENGLGGFQSVLSTYGAGLSNVDVDYIVKDKPNYVGGTLAFINLYNPSVGAPGQMVNVNLNYNEINSGSGGYGPYFAHCKYDPSGATYPEYLWPSSSYQLFDRITFTGRTYNMFWTSVAMTSLANQGWLDITKFQAYDDYNILVTSKQPYGLTTFPVYNPSGFVASNKKTYNPVVKFNGNSTGVTYTSQVGEYYIENGLCYVTAQVVFSSKGSSTGAATISVPISARADSNNPHPFVALGDNMSSLGGTIVGYAPSSGGTDCALLTQGATGTTGLTDTNFTNTTSLYFTVIYQV